MSWTISAPKMLSCVISAVIALQFARMLMMSIPFPGNQCGRFRWDWSERLKPPWNHGFVTIAGSAPFNAPGKLTPVKQ